MIKELRKSQGLTQQALADRADVPLRTIQKYEAGQYKVENMTLGMALRLAAALQVTPDKLIREKTDNPGV